MGARGPTPKPTARRQRSKAGDARKADLALLPPRFALPVPPEGLLESTRSDWDEFWRSEMGRMGQDTDVAALRRLFLYRDQWTRLAASLGDEEFTPYVAGSRGQVAMHPVYDQLEKLEGRILALEDRYGLNLRQRFALGASVVDTAKSLDDLNRRHVETQSTPVEPEAPVGLATK